MRALSKALRARLDALERGDVASDALVRRLRLRIRGGRYTPQGLRRGFARLATGHEGFDALDVLVAALLHNGAPDVEQVELGPDEVRYQPTPARVVLELIERTQLGPEDVLVDLGSGLGQVALLARLLSGARARGIEKEPAFCDYAQRSARFVGLSGVDFVCADAREAPLSGGTVYFLFTPFRRAVLMQVLERLKDEPALRLCTHGPCTEEVERVSWLERQSGGREVAVFRRSVLSIGQSPLDV